MVQPGGGLDLPEEALGSERSGELGTQDLEGDGPIVSQVVGQVDGRHAPAAELTFDAIAIGQSGRENVGYIRHRGRGDDRGKSPRQGPSCSTRLTPSAHRYRPRPNTPCVIRLLSLACIGLGVLVAATPRPNDGCITKNGNTTVPMP